VQKSETLGSDLRSKHIQWAPFYSFHSIGHVDSPALTYRSLTLRSS